jgi:hypothetical protein
VAIYPEKRGEKGVTGEPLTVEVVTTKHYSNPSNLAFNSVASSKRAIAIKRVPYCPAMQPYIALLLTN